MYKFSSYNDKARFWGACTKEILRTFSLCCCLTIATYILSVLVLLFRKDSWKISNSRHLIDLLRLKNSSPFITVRTQVWFLISRFIFKLLPAFSKSWYFWREGLWFATWLILRADVKGWFILQVTVKSLFFVTHNTRHQGLEGRETIFNFQRTVQSKWGDGYINRYFFWGGGFPL